MLIFSPHLDDAVLSLGETMLAHDGRPRVVTAFAGAPQNPRMVTAYDQQCGFGSSAAAVAARRLEDQEAMASIGAEPFYLDYLDRQYGPKYSVDDLIVEVARIMKGAGEEPIYAPLGIGHPDHALLSTTVLTAAVVSGQLVRLYEEMPDRVLSPEHSVVRLQGVHDAGWDLRLELPPYDDGYLWDKARAIECYRSQFPKARPIELCPERVWLATRPNPTRRQGQ